MDIKNNLPFVRYDRNLSNKSNQHKMSINGNSIKYTTTQLTNTITRLSNIAPQLNNTTSQLTNTISQLTNTTSQLTNTSKYKNKIDDVFLPITKSIDYIKLLENKLEEYSNKQLIETNTQTMVDKIISIEQRLISIENRLISIDKTTNIDSIIATINQKINNIEKNTIHLEKILDIYDNIETKTKDYDDKFQELFNILNDMVIEKETFI